MATLESKYRTYFNGKDPLELLGNTKYGTQMSTQWHERKIEQMMYGPHGSRINNLGEKLFLNGYEGRYLNVLDGDRNVYFYDLDALGLK